MDSRRSRIAIALDKSNKCHNEKIYGTSFKFTTLKYDKELNYIYITLEAKNIWLIKVV